MKYLLGIKLILIACTSTIMSLHASQFVGKTEDDAKRHMALATASQEEDEKALKDGAHIIFWLSGDGGKGLPEALRGLVLNYAEGELAFERSRPVKNKTEINSLAVCEDATGKLIGISSSLEYQDDDDVIPDPVVVWDLTSAKPLFRITDHKKIVMATALCKDNTGKVIAMTLQEDGSADIWDTTTQKRLCTIPTGHTLSGGLPEVDITLACDTKNRLRALSCCNKELKVWNVTDIADASAGKCMYELAKGASRCRLGKNKKGNLIAAAIHDTTYNEETASYNFGTLNLYNTATGKLLKKINPPDTEGYNGPRGILMGFNAVALCNDKKENLVAAALQDKKITIWDAKSGTCLYTLVPTEDDAFDDHLLTMEKDKKGDLIVAACTRGTIHVWNVTTNEYIKINSAHKDTISSLSLINDQNNDLVLISSSEDGTILKWKKVLGSFEQAWHKKHSSPSGICQA